jgi:hypothetical protein
MSDGSTSGFSEQFAQLNELLGTLKP